MHRYPSGHALGTGGICRFAWGEVRRGPARSLAGRRTIFLSERWEVGSSNRVLGLEGEFPSEGEGHSHCIGGFLGPHRLPRADLDHRRVIASIIGIRLIGETPHQRVRTRLQPGVLYRGIELAFYKLLSGFIIGEMILAPRLFLVAVNIVADDIATHFYAARLFILV